MDIFEKCFNYTTVKEAIRDGFYPYFIPLSENEGTEVDYRGHRLIMCGSNNYLGLTTHPKVREAAIDAITSHKIHCETGLFGADMQVNINNDGPVTILLDSTKLF